MNIKTLKAQMLDNKRRLDNTVPRRKQVGPHTESLALLFTFELPEIGYRERLGYTVKQSDRCSSRGTIERMRDILYSDFKRRIHGRIHDEENN